MSNRRPIGRGLSLAAVALILGGTLAAQANTIQLTEPEVEYPDPFTLITSIRELSSGKLYLSDLRDKLVLLLDLDAGSAMQVGREGRGPGEYSFPGQLLALPGDQTLLQDMIARRMMYLTPDGKPGEFLSLQNLSAGPITGLISIGGTDASGRFYFQGSPIGPGGQPADSVPILRWDGKGPVDTLLSVKNETVVQIGRGSGGTTFRMQIGAGSQSAFPSRVVWTVGPTGRIAVVSPDPYQVTWIEPDGRRSAGPAVPYTPVKVTEREKEAYRESRRNAGRVAVSFGGSGGGVSQQSVQLPDPEFPEVMPPFIGNSSLTNSTVLVDPGERIWVLRTRPASDETPKYDIFDRTGRLVGRATLNPRSRVVGFGNGAVYIARSDEDDLQYLQRFKL